MSKIWVYRTGRRWQLQTWDGKSARAETMEFGVETTETSTECRRRRLFSDFLWMRKFGCGSIYEPGSSQEMQMVWFGLNTQWIRANMCIMCCIFTGTLDPLLCWCISLMSPLKFCWYLALATSNIRWYSKFIARQCVSNSETSPGRSNLAVTRGYSRGFGGAAC